MRTAEWVGSCLLAAALAVRSVEAADEQARGSFFRNGDRWMLVGDSITNTDTYRQLVLRMLRHYHPDADIVVGNSAVNGVTSDYAAKREFKPTLVTIMLGMNNVIHRDWPYAVFASEMLNECNLTGCSVGIANPQYWGSMICMRWYRTRHASPVSGALCYPYAVRFDFSSEGDWQQDMHEKRAQIPGISVRWNLSGKTNTQALSGRSWLQAVRCQTFVQHGLRPVFPAQWDDRVLSYYKGQDGEDFRYVKTGWGTALVHVENGVETPVFARTCQVRYVPDPQGAIADWPLYVAAPETRPRRDPTAVRVDTEVGVT
jgi:hypothetical protein